MHKYVFISIGIIYLYINAYIVSKNYNYETNSDLCKYDFFYSLVIISIYCSISYFSLQLYLKGYFLFDLKPNRLIFGEALLVINRILVLPFFLTRLILNAEIIKCFIRENNSKWFNFKYLVNLMEVAVMLLIIYKGIYIAENSTIKFPIEALVAVLGLSTVIDNQLPFKLIYKTSISKNSGKVVYFIISILIIKFADYIAKHTKIYNNIYFYMFILSQIIWLSCFIEIDFKKFKIKKKLSNLQQ